MKMAINWNDLTEEVKVPADIAVAFAANRPELLNLARRAMNAEEVGGLIDAIRVLMDTNSYLQARSIKVAQQAVYVRGSLTSLQNTLDSLQTMAAFEDDDSSDD